MRYTAHLLDAHCGDVRMSDAIWTARPAEHSQLFSVVEFRDGEVPVIVSRVGHYSTGEYFRADGTCLCDSERVEVHLAKIRRGGLIIPEVGVARVTVGYGGWGLSRGHGVVRLEPSDVDGRAEEEQVALLLERAAPMIEAALADNDLVAGQEAAFAEIQAARESLPVGGFATREQYLAWCAEHEVEAIEDAKMSQWGPPIVGNSHWPQVSVKLILAEMAKLRRLKVLEQKREAALEARRPAPAATDRAKVLLPGHFSVGGELVYRGRRYVVLSSRPTKIEDDDPSLWGAHLLGHEGSRGAVLELGPPQA